MYTYEVKFHSGATHYVPADDYSTSPDGTRYLFWTKNKITRSFLKEEVSSILRQTASTEAVR